MIFNSCNFRSDIFNLQSIDIYIFVLVSLMVSLQNIMTYEVLNHS